MSIDQAVQLLLTVTLIELMWSLGLRVAWQDVWQTISQGPLLLKTLLANYLCVPLMTALLLRGFQADPLVSAGFLMLAVCPGAPFTPAIVGLAKGDVAAAVGLMAVLAATSAVIAPLSLPVLLPLLGGTERLAIDGVRLLTTLGVTQLAPLVAGLVMHQWLPQWAERLQRPASRLSLLLNLSSVVAILATQSAMLATVRGRALVGMALLFSLSLGIGWLLGGPLRSVRRTLSLTTALRNFGLSLVIATTTFPGTPAATAVLAYGLFGIVGALGLAVWWGQHPANSQPLTVHALPQAVKDDGIPDASPSGMIQRRTAANLTEAES